MQKLHTISTYNSLLSAKPQMMKLWQIISKARCYMINICGSTTGETILWYILPEH